jgi:hypothetical protein
MKVLAVTERISLLLYGADDWIAAHLIIVAVDVAAE